MILEFKRRSSSILIYPWYLRWNISRNCYLHLLFCYYFVKTEDTTFYFILCINNLNFNVFIIIEWYFFFLAPLGKFLILSRFNSCQAILFTLQSQISSSKLRGFIYLFLLLFLTVFSSSAKRKESLLPAFV